MLLLYVYRSFRWIGFNIFLALGFSFKAYPSLGFRLKFKTSLHVKYLKNDLIYSIFIPYFDGSCFHE